MHKCLYVSAICAVLFHYERAIAEPVLLAAVEEAGHIYAVYEAPGISWFDANDYANIVAENPEIGCGSSHLVTISDENENLFVAELKNSLGGGQFYAGGYQNPGVVPPEAGWQWVTGEPWDYTNWASGEPNDAYGPASEQWLGLGWPGSFWNDEAALGNIRGFIVEIEDLTPPSSVCVPTTNPSGKNAPKAGDNPKSGQNPDGFYQLLAADDCDPAAMLWIYDPVSGVIAGPFVSGDRVKITQDADATPEVKTMARGIVAHLILNGDAEVYATDNSGNTSETSYCLVPQPPK